MAVSAVRPLHISKSATKSDFVGRESEENQELQTALILEERDVIKRVLSGQKEEFKIFVERYQSRALAVAIGLVGNRDDAQD